MWLDRSDGAAARHLPVDHHVAEHELHREAVAGKSDADRFAHCAVRAVAADDVAKLRTLDCPVAARELDGDMVAIVAQALERDVTFDADAEAHEVGGEKTLGGVLRQAEITVGQVRQIGDHLAHRPARNDHAQAVDPEAGIDHLARDPHVVPHFEGTRSHADRLAIARGRREAIDDAAGLAMPGELRRHGEADRTGADDEHFGHRAAPTISARDER